MAITFTQTDTNMSGTCSVAAFCSSVGGSHQGEDFGKSCTPTGSAGSSGETFSVAAAQGDDIEWSFMCVPAAGSTRQSGDWTVNFDFTAGSMTVVLASVFMCRVNSSCVNQETMDSDTGLTIATNAGDQSHVLTDGGGTFDAGDVIVFVCGFTETGGHSAGSITIVPSLTIASPWDPPPASGRRIFAVT